MCQRCLLESPSATGMAEVRQSIGGKESTWIMNVFMGDFFFTGSERPEFSGAEELSSKAAAS